MVKHRISRPFTGVALLLALNFCVGVADATTTIESPSVNASAPSSDVVFASKPARELQVSFHGEHQLHVTTRTRWIVVLSRYC